MPKRTASRYPKPAKSWQAPVDDKKSTVFIHSCLDDYGLDVYEFRILCHVARRESKERGCDASQSRMAETCGMSQRMVQKALSNLCEVGILSKQKAKGKRTNMYRVNSVSKWKNPEKLQKIRQNQRE